MKLRTRVSIIICVVFLLLSSSLFAFAGYISSGGHPGLNTNSFAPAVIKKVPDEKDITVKVFPTGGPKMHGFDYENGYEVKLNCIRKGWIVAKYNGNCRLLFEISDADMEDFGPGYEKKHYYYAEIIPRQRLRVTDITARQRDDPENPFTSGKTPAYLSCCISSEVYNYRVPRVYPLVCAGVNLVFILFVMGINLLIKIIRGEG